LKLLTSFLLSYPLAALLKRIPDSKPWQKNCFIIAVSLFYLVGLFDLWAGLRTILISSVAAYAIAYYIDGSFMPWIGFIFLMGHMSVNHIIRQATNNPSAVDITGAQMVLVMKLTAFCWNVHDGRIKSEYLNEYQKEKAIYKMPSFLDYAGFVLFFPSFLVGPAFDYNDYRRWIETTMFDVPEGVDVSKAAPTRKQRKIPRSGRPAAWKAASGLGWIALFLKFSTWYSVPLVLSDDFMKYNFFHRVWILEMLGLTTRLKYYGVWSLTEGACILSGMGYGGIDPKTGKTRWDRLNNVNPWGIESAQNSRAYLENWNKNTNNWLRHYIYLRVTPHGKKPGFRASLATFTTSAFWHGFYPGYYLTFILGAFIQTVAKNSRRYFRPFFMSPDGKTPTPNKRYYDIFSYFVTQTAFCFTTLPFVTLGLGESLTVWARVYFYCVIGVALSLGFFASPAKPWLIKRINKRNHPVVKKTVSEETYYEPALGLPSDPGRDIDEALDEIREEVESRRRRGSKATMPSGSELLRAVEDKIGKKLTYQDGKVKAT
jgi:lysophospholipid acyltransferase